ncbi:hypothetical protein JCM15765_35730 [Paradesulfitobacterium aromaticivorans]
MRSITGQRLPKNNQEMINQGVGPSQIIDDRLIANMNVVGVRFKAEDNVFRK